MRLTLTDTLAPVETQPLIVLSGFKLGKELSKGTLFDLRCKGYNTKFTEIILKNAVDIILNRYFCEKWLTNSWDFLRIKHGAIEWCI